MITWSHATITCTTRSQSDMIPACYTTANVRYSVITNISVNNSRLSSSLSVVLTNAQDLRCSSRFRCVSTHARTPRKHLDPSNGKDKQNAICIQGVLPGSAALTAGDRASRRSNCRNNSKAYSVSFNSSSNMGTSVR